MKKLNQKAFSEQISEYSVKELAFCLGHIFLAMIKRNSSSDNIAYLKHWCSQTIDSAVRFHEKHKKS